MNLNPTEQEIAEANAELRPYPEILVNVAIGRISGLLDAAAAAAAADDPDTAARYVRRARATTAVYRRIRDAALNTPPADPPGGPEPADTVWMSTIRRGIDAHRITGDTPAPTGCGRSTRTGVRLPWAQARARDATVCPRCWPPAGGAA